MGDTEPTKVGNVIMFPGISRNRPPQSFEEICHHVALAKTTRIEEVVESVVVNMFEDLYGHNYDFSNKQEANKDMAFLIEAVKSVMHRHDGLDHPFHELADEYFTEDAAGELTFVTIVEVTDIEEDMQ